MGENFFARRPKVVWVLVDVKFSKPELFTSLVAMKAKWKLMSTFGNPNPSSRNRISLVVLRPPVLALINRFLVKTSLCGNCVKWLYFTCL